MSSRPPHEPTEEPGICGYEVSAAMIAGNWQPLSPPSPSASPLVLGAFLRRLGRLAACWRAERRERRRLRSLAVLDDRLLHDIGLTSRELHYRAGVPFWRDVWAATAIETGPVIDAVPVPIALPLRPRHFPKH